MQTGGFARAKWARTMVAFAIAPAVPVLVFWAFTSPFTAGGFTRLMLYGCTVSYLAAGIIGVPAYFLITRWSRLRSWHVLWLSSLAGAVAFTVLEKHLTSWAVIGALLGFLAGVTFWIIWRRNEDPDHPSG